MVGRLLGLLDSLGIMDNTIVMYSTDNGAEKFSWPDGGSSPFRNEKASNWEGAYRVPGMIRWPGTVKPGTVLNDIVSHEDWVPTLVSAAGNPNVTQQLLAGTTVGGKTFKVHLDGYNLTDYLSGKGPDPRKEFFYFNDDGSLVALRYNQWKIVFQEQRAEGLGVWQDPFVPLRAPKLFNVRSDPFEIADHEIDRLRQVVRRARVRDGARAGLRGAVPEHLPATTRRARRRAASRSIGCWNRCRRGDRKATRRGSWQRGEVGRALPRCPTAWCPPTAVPSGTPASAPAATPPAG